VSAKRGGRSTLKAFVQSWLAKPFADVSHRITFAVLRAHCLDYKIGTVPSYHATLMMTTDVQSDGFYWLVRAWSYRATSWLIKYGFVESWPELARAEQQVFNGINDDKFVIHRNWIDSGDGKRTEEVYYECAKRRGFRRPLKGVWQYRGGSMVSPLKIQHRGLRGWNIDSAQAFDHLFGVRMEIPAGQPGHWGLPSDIDTDYLRSIATWKRREEKKDGREIKYWKASDESIEHYGDLEKYQVAAAAQMNFEFLEPPAANASRSERGRFVDQYGRPFLVTER